MKKKWNYRALFLGRTSDKTRQKFSSPQFLEFHSVKSLPWNDFEKTIIFSFKKGVKKFFKINNIQDVFIKDEQIVILNKEQYNALIKDEKDRDAFFSYGYSYVYRNNDKSMFINHLSHELSHFYSFYSLTIKESGNRRFIFNDQLGYKKTLHNGIVLYNGLNEAVTEIFSKIMLKMLLQENSQGLFVNDIKRALSEYSYSYHVVLLEELILKSNQDNLIFSLFKSFFDGSDDFIKLLDEKMPAVNMVFKEMGTTSEDALKAAYIIGGEPLVDKVNNLEVF